MKRTEVFAGFYLSGSKTSRHTYLERPAFAQMWRIDEQDIPRFIRALQTRLAEIEARKGAK